MVGSGQYTCDVWKDCFINGMATKNIQCLFDKLSFINAFFSSLIEEVVCIKLPLCLAIMILHCQEVTMRNQAGLSLDKCFKNFQFTTLGLRSIKLSTTSASAI